MSAHLTLFGFLETGLKRLTWHYLKQLLSLSIRSCYEIIFYVVLEDIFLVNECICAYLCTYYLVFLLPIQNLLIKMIKILVSLCEKHF